MSSAKHDMQSSLAELRGIVGLVVFAIEARLVLGEIDAVANGIPYIDKTLSVAIDARRQWSAWLDTAAEVLGRVYERLNDLLGDEG